MSDFYAQVAKKAELSQPMDDKMKEKIAAEQRTENFFEEVFRRSAESQMNDQKAEQARIKQCRQDQKGLGASIKIKINNEYTLTCNHCGCQIEDYADLFRCSKCNKVYDSCSNCREEFQKVCYRKTCKSAKKELKDLILESDKFP